MVIRILKIFIQIYSAIFLKLPGFWYWERKSVDKADPGTKNRKVDPGLRNQNMILMHD